MGVLKSGVAAVVWLWDHSLGFLLTWFFIGLISLYRLVISPILGPTCRYYPSCSAYGLESMHVHGGVKGLILTSWRLLRCNPLSGGGLDPVPDRGQWRPDILPNGEPRPASRAQQTSASSTA
jgi:uncharacterized protein